MSSWTSERNHTGADSLRSRAIGHQRAITKSNFAHQDGITSISSQNPMDPALIGHRGCPQTVATQDCFGHQFFAANNAFTADFHGHFYDQNNPGISFNSVPNLYQSPMSPIDLQPQSSTSVSLPMDSSRTLHQQADEEYDSSDSDTGTDLSHPNKYPVQIEFHNNKQCNYQRQPTRSGEKMKQRNITTYDPATWQTATSTQHIKYYQKDLVRVCRCGSYNMMDGALTHGRKNDCDGYEIHYSQKCKWKAYDDYKTGKRVLIRLCKCYKPSMP